MNERITELAEQAQQYAEYVTPQGCEWFDTFKEKFAELLVQECAEFVSNDRQNDDYGVFIANRIKQHFGVEECGTKN